MATRYKTSSTTFFTNPAPQKDLPDLVLVSPTPVSGTSPLPNLPHADEVIVNRFSTLPLDLSPTRLTSTPHHVALEPLVDHRLENTRCMTVEAGLHSRLLLYPTLFLAETHGPCLCLGRLRRGRTSGKRSLQSETSYRGSAERAEAGVRRRVCRKNDILRHGRLHMASLKHGTKNGLLFRCDYGRRRSGFRCIWGEFWWIAAEGRGIYRGEEIEGSEEHLGRARVLVGDMFGRAVQRCWMNYLRSSVRRSRCSGSLRLKVDEGIIVRLPLV
ncbi:hypothetical protein FPV67DRAFT_1723964 [Lyophyllum atratum]|nr:hypothetical protein FPV67DRAFT_1723964 [Lyophyllum atratum]